MGGILPMVRGNVAWIWHTVRIGNIVMLGLLLSANGGEFWGDDVEN
jgi:hypothetical protein